MKVQALSLPKKFIYSALYFSICIGWTDLETLASEIQLKRTGHSGNMDESGSEEDSLRPSGRIIGGIVSVPHSHPYMVRLLVKLKKDKMGCGGVILNEEWILTAAHCLYKAVSVVVKAGRHNMSKKEKTGQEVNGTQFIFDLFNAKKQENDIGFVKVSPKLQLNAYVTAAVLADAKWDKSSGMATVAGWGLTTLDPNATSNKVLREVDVPLMSNPRCGLYYINDTIFDTNICAGWPQGKRDACQGDSGGPLFVKENGTEVVVGIVSWGEPCALPGQPTVYARVSKYRDYIKTKTGYKKSGRTSLSSVIGESLCEQYNLFLNEDRLIPPVKERPRTETKCGWFDWKGNCDSQSCNPFSVANC